jgi:hypothetical protein
MDTIPLLYLKGGKLVKPNTKKWIWQRKSPSHVFTDFSREFGEVYVMDLDGHQKNRAHLDVYHSMSRKISLWVDAGPRNPGDVMDLFISGVHRITLKWELMDDNYLKEIREMCTGEIFLAARDRIQDTLEKVKKIGFDGIVVRGIPNIWQTLNKPVWSIVSETNGRVMVKKLDLHSK